MNVSKKEMTEKPFNKEQIFSDIVLKSPVGIVIYNHSGRCIFANDAIAGMIGATKQQVLDQNYHDIEPWKRSGLLDVGRTVVEKKSAMRCEVVTVSSLGKNVFLDCHLVPFNSNGLLLMAQDITKRKQAEYSLQKTLKSLNNSQKLAKVGSWEWDIQKGSVEWSEEVYHIFGLDLETFVPRIDSIMESFHPDDRKLHDSLIQQALENRERCSFDARIFMPDGNIRFLVSTSEGCYDDSGNLVAIAGTVQDITERKTAEQALSSAKAYSEMLVESANAIIVVLDPHGCVQVMNQAAEAITGYTRREMYGKNWFEILVPKDRYSTVWNTYLTDQEEGLPSSFENPIVTKEGCERFISWRNTKLQENGVFSGSISYGIDVTERKKLEDQLLQTQKMEALGEMTGGIAHDFNNMLSVILGHAEILKSCLPPGDPLLKSVLEIEKAGIHSRDITRQLLGFSRRQIIAPKTANLNQLIDKLVKTLSKIIGENIEIRFISEQDLWNIRIDLMQVDQILYNLSSNARDAMPDGGILTIETSNAELDEIYCASHVECSPGQYVVLSVSDNGIGIKKETISRIFEPFWTSKGMGKGTGLGLATVYGIARQNGGFVTVYSEPGKGSTFRIHLPRLMGELQEKVEATEIAPIDFQPATVLLVEDDDMVRSMTKAILEKIGYNVVLSESSKEALEIVEKDPAVIDLLITDVIMPQMSGMELAAEINKIKSGVKVLFMSGYTENVIVRQGILKEGIHFVQKPFNMKELAKKIKEAIDNEG